MGLLRSTFRVAALIKVTVCFVAGMFSNAKASVLPVIVFLGGVASQYMCVLPLEAENGSGGSPKSRSNASGGLSVLLFQKEDIVFYLLHRKTNFLCELSSFNLTYSNDGPGDTLEILLNMSSLSSIKTYAQSRNGDYWNLFQTVKVPIQKMLMNEGQYTIVLSAVETDKYGFEIDKCSLVFECSQKMGEGTGCPADTFAVNNNFEADGHSSPTDILSDGSHEPDGERGALVH